jgi:hypothetical protein
MENKRNGQTAHTPGPYDIRATPGGHDAEIYSEATGESVARVLSGSSHGDAPEDETALRNAALLRAAPQLHESLARILTHERERLRPETANSASQLLAGIAAGAGEKFRRERAEELRAFDEMIADQIHEMSSRQELTEEFDEEFGHSF